MSKESSKTLKKFCSLLTYIEHKNRDLYDTIQDLCLSSIFNTRRGRSVTFLMPDPNSSFHTKIVNAAYGQDPNVAIDLIKACTIPLHLKSLDDFSKADGGKLPNELKQELEIATPNSKQVILKNGDAAIIADTSFLPLYDTSRFGVFIIKSGKVNTDNVSVSDKSKSNTEKKMDTFEGAFEVSGGAPALSEQERKKTPYQSPEWLVKYMIDYDISNRKSKEDRPSFLKSGSDENVFTTMAVSFLTYVKDNYPDNLSDYTRLLHPNPMCIGAILCKWADPEHYAGWRDMEDEKTDYSYTAYVKFLEGQKKTEVATVDVVKKAIEYIKSRDLANVMLAVKCAYNDEYKANGLKMLLYHESLFVLNSYIRCINNGDFAMAKVFGNIYATHYCANSSPMIISESTLGSELSDASYVCKAFEFIRSDTFLYPNDHADRASDIITNTEPSVDFNMTVYDFSSLIKEMFDK